MARFETCSWDDLKEDLRVKAEAKNALSYITLRYDDVLKLELENGDPQRHPNKDNAGHEWFTYAFSIKRKGYVKPFMAHIALGVFLNSPYAGNGFQDSEDALLRQRGTDSAIFKNGLIRSEEDVMKALKTGVRVAEVFVSEKDEKGRTRRCFRFEAVRASAQEVWPEGKKGKERPSRRGRIGCNSVLLDKRSSRSIEPGILSRRILLPSCLNPMLDGFLPK